MSSIANDIRAAIKSAIRANKVRAFAAIADGVKLGVIRPEVEAKGGSAIDALNKMELTAVAQELGIDTHAIEAAVRSTHLGQTIATYTVPPAPVIQTAHAPEMDGPEDEEEREDAQEEKDDVDTTHEEETDPAVERARETLSAMGGIMSMLAPDVRDSLMSSVTNLAREALRPRMVASVTPLHSPAPRQASQAHATGSAKASDVFKLRHRALDKLMVRTWSGYGAPAVDPGFVWSVDTLIDMVLWIESGEPAPLWLFGKRGTGKTTLVMQYCAYTGRNYVRISGRPDMESIELYGQNTLQNGSDYFKEGVLARSMVIPGTIIHGDELSLAQRTHPAWQTLLDERFVTLFEDGGRVVRMADGVCVIASDNSNGTAENADGYVGVTECNVAFMDRFSAMLEIGYLSEADEAKALVSRTGCTQGIADLLARFAARTRTADSGCSEGVSFRRLKAFAIAVTGRRNAERAFETTILAPLRDADRILFDELRKTVFPTWREVDALAAGVISKAAPPRPADPSNAAAKTTFDELQA